jgi:tetratricopeptide (TPR) repeat protein
LPARLQLGNTPFFPQDEYQCGPAALAMVMNHAGINITPDALVPQVYLPERQGSLQTEILTATRRQGLVAYVLAPQLVALLREVAAGTPVLVLQNLAFNFAPVWHYAVVVGYDLAREEITLRSGVTRDLVLTLTNFEHTWARSDYWAMVALPPDRLPASAAEDQYVSAAVALERTSASAAQRAYATALTQWPRNLTARIGMGNTAYALHDLRTAETAYRRATNDHPAAADAWNNLAQVLLERGRKEDALPAAERAVALGGPRIAQYRATLEAIKNTR